MNFVDVIAALLVGTLLTAIFVLVLRKRGPWQSVFRFFLLVSLSAWVGGLYLNPLGPVVFNTRWLPFFLAGLIVAVILSVITPIKVVRDRSVKPESGIMTKAVFLGWFFWAWVLGYIAAIAVYYFG